MKQFIAFLAVIAICHGANYNALRVKFSLTETGNNVDYWYRIPRTHLQAVAQGWTLTTRPPGSHPLLRMYCPAGRFVCALYDILGNVAGLQCAIPVDQFVSPMDLSKHGSFTTWRARATLTEPARDFYVSTQYFSANISTYPVQTINNEGVFFPDLTGTLKNIPITQDGYSQTEFTIQACVPGMGLHYYYNMTSALDCTYFVPWFAMTLDGETVTTGFQVFGMFPAPPDQRDWYERPGPIGAIMAIPNRSDCIYDWAVQHGTISLHIYYTEDPWTIPCRG